MERARVLVRLGGGAGDADARPGICRTSATTVRLEHSDMSPGVASITFEQVFDAAEHSNAQLFSQSLAAGVDAAAQGKAVTVVLSGAPGAGKSFTCHGSSQPNVPGVATLAIRRVFSQLEAHHGNRTEYQVLLTCLYVSDEGELVDCIEAVDTQQAIRGNWREGVASWLVERGVRVGSSAEAVHLYSRARRCSGERDFVLAIHVEAGTEDGRIIRGRFVCIDVHGNCVIEPGMALDTPESASLSVLPPQAPHFQDTHFPVNRTLSEAFGSFLGNTNITYIVVAIRKAAQYQQQAIQALLFACKAKDIRSACTISYLSAFTTVTRGSRSSSSSSNNASGQDNNAEEPALPESPKEASPLAAGIHSQESHSSPSLDNPNSPVSSEPSSIKTGQVEGALPPANLSAPRSPTTAATATSDHAALLLQKRLVVSNRLRKAYEIAKAATSAHNPPSFGGVSSAEAALMIQDGNETDSSNNQVVSSRTRALHQLADAILAALEWRPASQLQTEMSLLQKLELIRLQHEDLERALAHEVTVKGKCVDRISKLTQTMGLQVAEHEKQLADALATKQIAETKLRAMEAKFTGVAEEIVSLQQQVAAMKSAAASAMTATVATIREGRSESVPTPPPTVAPCSCKLDERSILQGFATKLEAAMQDAKSVVDFKDGVIRDLETRLQDVERRSAESSALFEREKLRLSSDNSALVESLEQLRTQLLAKDERVREETFRAQQDQADLMVKMAQLTLSVETQRNQWTKREQELEAAISKATDDEKRASDEIAALGEEHGRMQSDLNAIRRKYVALQAAHAGAIAATERLETSLRYRHQEVEIQGLIRKLNKRKAKLDRARTLLADRKQQIAQANALVEQLTQQLEVSAKERNDAHREATSLKRQLSAKASEVEGLGSMKRVLEDAVDTLKEQLIEQQDDHEQLVQAEQVMEEAAQQATIDALEEQKLELTRNFEQRLYELEQSFGRRVVAREAQLQQEHDVRVRELMEQHSAELLRLQHGKPRSHRDSDKDAVTVVHDDATDTPSRRDDRRRRRLESLERQLSSTRTASLSSSSSSRSSSSGTSRSSSPLSPLPSPLPTKGASSAPTTPRQQSIRDLDALIVEKERRYDQHAANPRRTPTKSHGGSNPSPAKLEGRDVVKQYKKALAKKQIEVDELQRRTQQLLNALATANEEETVAKARAEQVARAQEQGLAKFDALLQELNRVKQENWSLSLALQVTEKARP